MWVVLEREIQVRSGGRLYDDLYASGCWDDDLKRIFKVERVFELNFAGGFQLHVSTYGALLPETYHSSWLKPYGGFSKHPTDEEIGLARMLGYNV